MKKICTTVFLTLTLIVCLYSGSQAQTAASVQKQIELVNKQFVKWFNSGKPDSIVSQYHADACITGKGCGKTFLLNYYQSETGKYTFSELTTQNVTLNGNKAIETGQWKIALPNGVELSGKYSSEWQQVNNRWMILKETLLD